MVATFTNGFSLCKLYENFSCAIRPSQMESDKFQHEFITIFYSTVVLEMTTLLGYLNI